MVHSKRIPANKLPEKQVRINLYVSPVIKSGLQRIAQHEETTVMAIVRKALRRYVEVEQTIIGTR